MVPRAESTTVREFPGEAIYIPRTLGSKRWAKKLYFSHWVLSFGSKSRRFAPFANATFDKKGLRLLCGVFSLISLQ